MGSRYHAVSRVISPLATREQVAVMLDAPAMKPKEKTERRFRRELRELEEVRSNLSETQRKEVNAARRHLKIHNWFHYAPIIFAIHTKHFGSG
jgi:hypothetical protein